MLKRVESAHTVFTNGIARLTAPRASVPTPFQTNIPSTIVSMKKLMFPIIAGMMYFFRFFLCSLIVRSLHVMYDRGITIITHGGTFVNVGRPRDFFSHAVPM